MGTHIYTHIYLANWRMQISYECMMNIIIYVNGHGGIKRIMLLLPWGGWIGAQIGFTYLCLRFHYGGHFTRWSNEQAHILMQDKALGQILIIHWH